MPNKIDELKSRIYNTKYNPDIIGITEVFPKNARYTILPAELTLPGYELFINVNPKLGSGLYIKKELNPVEYKMETQFKESVWVKVKLNKNDNLLVGCIYKSPSCDKQNLLELRKLLSNTVDLSRKFSHILILGDFNFPKIDWNTWYSENDKESELFIECVRDSYLHQHITTPTRSRLHQGPNVLDLVFTNEEDMIKDVTYESPLGKSDHCVLTFQYHCYYEKNTNKIARKNFFKGNYEKLRKQLDVDWNRILNTTDMEIMTSAFMNIHNKAVDECIPIIDPAKSQNAKKHNYVPLDWDTVKTIKKKHRSWQRYIETKDEKKYREYTQLRNKTRKLVRKAKKNMEREIANDVKKNPKRFWKYVNSKRKVKTGISELKYEDGDGTHTSSTDQEKAETLSNFFKSVFTIEPPGDIPFVDNKPVSHVFMNNPITEEEVMNILDRIDTSKAMGPDGVHPKVIKEARDVLCKPITMLFNKSLSSGVVPNTWKTGNITALFKKGEKSDPGNYRPVSLTSVLCKLMEKVIRARIVDHMKQNTMFSKQQFGFMSGRSTVLQLLKVIEEWSEILDEGGTLDVVYMDFMKAFDTVPHRRLLNKIKSYGISDLFSNWINCFLSDRHQTVIVNGTASRSQQVTSGIPQGSVLGPLLFVIYINDLPDSVKSPVFMFADDTKLYNRIRSEEDKNQLQIDLDALQLWSDTWLLKFHPEKCKVLSIYNRSQSKNIAENDYYLYDNNHQKINLDHIDTEKDIGVLVDSMLTFSNHIHAQVNKANSIMGLIRRSYTYLDEVSFKSLFQALVRPHLEYAECVWNPYKQKDITLIENVQRRATKWVPTLKHLSYPERLMELKLPTLKYRRHRGDMIEVFKIVSGKYDREVSGGILKFNENTTTRGNQSKLLKQRCRYDVRKYSFSQRVIDMWNDLPDSVISAKSVFSFEVRLDKLWEKQEMKFDALYAYKRPGSHAKKCVDAI